MRVHNILPESGTLHGSFSRDYRPIITIDSGDTLQLKTLDARWGYYSGYGSERLLFQERDKEKDQGHALCGPIEIKGAKAGMTLEIRINELIPGGYGFNISGRMTIWPYQQLQSMGNEEITLSWKLDNQAGKGCCQIGNRKLNVALKPFMGVMGMPPDEDGIHTTNEPRYCGGNIDCKELVAGSSLYLPIAVDGGLFSIGDGHAAQGDGEVCGQAIECPMDLVDITLKLHKDMLLTMPRAKTPNGWITFGLDEDLNKATINALDGMLDLLCELYSVNRVEAMALASVAVDLHTTQIVNGVKGVHAVLPHGAIR